VVAELQVREAQCPHRLRPMQTLLENHRDALLAFAAVVDQGLAALVEEFAVPVRSVLQAQALAGADPQRWQRQAGLWQQVGRAMGRCRKQWPRSRHAWCGPAASSRT
jgi:hypothetical protein